MLGTEQILRSCNRILCSLVVGFVSESLAPAVHAPSLLAEKCVLLCIGWFKFGSRAKQQYFHP